MASEKHVNEIETTNARIIDVVVIPVLAPLFQVPSPISTKAVARQTIKMEALLPSFLLLQHPGRIMIISIAKRESVLNLIISF